MERPLPTCRNDGYLHQYGAIEPRVKVHPDAAIYWKQIALISTKVDCHRVPDIDEGNCRKGSSAKGVMKQSEAHNRNCSANRPRTSRVGNESHKKTPAST